VLSKAQVGVRYYFAACRAEGIAEAHSADREQSDAIGSSLNCRDAR
jgi:hypothetical protein